MMDDFNDGVKAKLVSRMRTANPEQFYTIVKMHLSFELDINTDDNDCITEKAKLKKWGILCFSKKPKSTMNLQKGADSSALTEEGISQVKRLIHYLSLEQCITQEGIFRRTGSLTRQQDLKISLHQHSPLNLDEAQYNVHDCASVLKNYLAELPEPLLTDLHYPAHCQIAKLCNDEARLLRVLQLLLLLLPKPNRILLKHIIGLLNKTATFESSNKMNCDTLATLFTPHLMCPRKLSPEALHINSQTLSGLVAFMIRKGSELFEIPEKLAIEVRAYWVNQERKMMSPNKYDTNELTSDAKGTAQTVFSFVDHKLTAEATTKNDTEFAVAELCATINSMPKSAYRDRLMKKVKENQLNKENSLRTPQSSGKTKRLGDSIKKHVFQKKILGHNKKSNNRKVNGTGLTRSSSDENVFTTNIIRLHVSNQCSKSIEDLDMRDSFGDCNLMTVKRMTSSTGSIDTPVISKFKRFIRNESSSAKSSSRDGTPKKQQAKGRRLADDNETPLSCFSNSLPEVERTARANFVRENEEFMRECESAEKLVPSSVTHTSTPSDLVHRAIPSDHHTFTPIAKDKSMSPITQSATKMTKAMQETMMTPRSRNPIMMISGSNICDFANSTSKTKFQIHKTCQSIVEEKAYHWTGSFENLYDTSDYALQCREYPNSQNYILDVSPVDLSFSSRTDDYEQSESESKVESDTSGIVSGSSGSPEESPFRGILSPRKRGTSLQRHDSKVMAKGKYKQISELNLQKKVKDGHVTSF